MGAPGNAGKVSVFEYNTEESDWTQMGADIELEQSADSAGLGHIVALSQDGQTMVAGAPYFAQDRGLVLVLQYDAVTDSWKETLRLVGEEDKSQFGYAVAIASDILAVGAKNFGKGNQGQVNVFCQDKEGWSLLASPIYGEKIGDYFGFSLSLSIDGRILAVGSPYYDTAAAGRDAGLVQVYKVLPTHPTGDCGAAEECSAFPGSLVSLGQSLSGDRTGDFFGYSVSLSSNGHRLAVGARQVHHLTGQVKVYDYEPFGGVWKQSASPIDGDANTDQSGFSVGLSGDGETLAIGSPYHDVSIKPTSKKPNAGQARIFLREAKSSPS